MTATARAQVAAIQETANRNGYAVEYLPTRKARKNGWPVRSAKPFALFTYCDGNTGGEHLASFATFAALERSFYARAGL